MGAFFTGWQLWEEMSFVLGCSIVLVFAFGLIRLWWTNRRIKKFELIEEERRARLAQMQQCGITGRGGITDIPFGVRAIQNGIEVEGIWISRPNTPEASRVASQATLVGDASTDPSNKGKGRFIEHGFEERRRSQHTSSGSFTDQTVISSSSPQARPAPGARYMTPLSADDVDLEDGQQFSSPQGSTAYVESYMPTSYMPTGYTPAGLPEDQRRSHTRNQSSRGSSSMAAAAPRGSLGSYVIDSANHPRNPYFNPSSPSGPAELYADTSMATSSHDMYGVHPTATWEHVDYDSGSDAEALGSSGQLRKSGYAKLQKKSHPR